MTSALISEGFKNFAKCFIRIEITSLIDRESTLKEVLSLSSPDKNSVGGWASQKIHRHRVFTGVQR